MIALLLIVLAASCNKTEIDKSDNFPKDGIVRINTPVTELRNKVVTPYVGSNLGLSMNYGTGLEEYNKSNILWENSNDNWITQTPISWKDNTTPLAIYAYAPYVSGVSSITSIPFSVSSDQTAGVLSSDLLGFKNTNFIPGRDLLTNQSLDIHFNHKLSNLNINFVFGVYEADVSVQSVITHAKGSVTYNAETGEVSTVTDGAVVVITSFKNLDGSFSVIIPPQVIIAGTELFTITLSNGDIFRYIAPTGGHLFESGSSYEVDLKLGKNSIILGNISVNDWNVGTPIDGNLDKEEILTPIGSTDITIPTTEEFRLEFDSTVDDVAVLSKPDWITIVQTDVLKTANNFSFTSSAILDPTNSFRQGKIVLHSPSTGARQSYDIEQYASFIYNTTSGLLASELQFKFKENWRSLTHLNMAGTIDSRDLTTLVELSEGNLSYINLSEANIVGKEIGDGAFGVGTNLETIILPNDITSLGLTAFGDCVRLRWFEIPATVVNMGIGVFLGCNNMNEVDVLWSSKELIPILTNNDPHFGNVFPDQFLLTNTSNPKTIYVPAGLVDIYKSVDGWNIYRLASRP